jgi:hypothetical protein
MKIVLISQRAQILLLIDSGETHAEAAKQTGLSIGQVRYALNRFRKRGLSMFPGLPEEDQISELLATEPNLEDALTEITKKKKSKKKKKTEKKSKIKKDKKKKGKKKDHNSEKTVSKKKKKGKKSKKDKKK